MKTMVFGKVLGAKMARWLVPVAFFLVLLPTGLRADLITFWNRITWQEFPYGNRLSAISMETDTSI